MKIIAILFTVSLFIVNTSHAQAKFEKRIELERVNQYYGLLIPFSNHGFALFHDNVGLNVYDTDLQKKGDISIPQEKGYFINYQLVKDSLVYLFFAKRRTNFRIVVVNVNSMAIENTFNGGPDSGYKDTFKSFSVTKNSIVIEGMNIFYRIDMKTGKQIKLYNASEGNIEGYKTIYDTDELFVFFSKTLKNKKVEMIISQYSKIGQKINVLKLNKIPNYSITDLNVTKSPDSSLLFTGTFYPNGTAEKRSRYNKIYSHQEHKSEGAFVSKVKNNSIDFMNYYSFKRKRHSAFSFSDKKKTDWDQVSDKGDLTNISSNIICHDIISTNDGYILIGESYYEVYSYYVDSNGRMKEKLDGYQYTHGVVVKFNLNGEKVWDNSFYFNVLEKNSKLRKLITVKVDKENELIQMLYSKSGVIHSRTLTMDGDWKNNREYLNSVNVDTDVIIEDQSNLYYWYDNYFLSRGYQKLKSREEPLSERTIEVRYISKVKID